MIFGIRIQKFLFSILFIFTYRTVLRIVEKVTYKKLNAHGIWLFSEKITNCNVLLAHNIEIDKSHSRSTVYTVIFLDWLSTWADCPWPWMHRLSRAFLSVTNVFAPSPAEKVWHWYLVSVFYVLWIQIIYISVSF